MNAASTRRAGGPFTALVILLGGWALVRAALWQSPFPESLPDLGLPGFDGPAPVIAAQSGAADEGRSRVDALRTERPLAPMRPYRLADPLEAGPWMQQSATYPSDRFQISPTGSLTPGAADTGRSGITAHHQMLFAAGFAYAPSAAQFRRLVAQRNAQANRPAMAAASAWPLSAGKKQSDRWSLDGWALWRSGSGKAFAAATPSPSYGASQAGAVLRYRIKPDSPYRPQAYMRATRALVTDGESEIAAGLSARPMARLPLRGHAEMRATKRPGTTEIRPAAFVTTEIPPQKLPAGLQASFYAQGGYVGGDVATAFADGQLRVDRDVARFDLANVQVGAGAWGGAQKGAARLDVGPSATVALARGPVPARLSVDYRVRVAGDAQPGSGVAVTLTTGF